MTVIEFLGIHTRGSALGTQHPALCLLLLLLCLAGPALAADDEAEGWRDVLRTKGAFLGYKTAIDIALSQHPSIRKAQQSTRAAGAVVGQATAKLYPQLDAYAIQTGGTIRPLSGFNIAGAQNKPTSYVENAGFRADQLIFDFGQTLHAIRAERAAQDASEKDLLGRRASVLLRVQQAYLHCRQQQRLVQIAETTVRERGVLRDQIAALHKRELKSKLDLDLMTLELRNAEVRLVQARHERLASFAALNHAMGVEGAEEYTLEDAPSLPRPTDTLESLVELAIASRPESMGSSDRLRSAEERLQSTRAQHLPTVSATGMWGVIHFSDAPLNQYGGAHVGQTNQWWGAAAVVSVPLFTGFLIENRVAESLQQKYKAQQKQSDLLNKIALEVNEAYLTLQTAEQQIKVEQQEVTAAHNALALAKERYRLGLSSVVDVTSATTAALAAEVRLADARYTAEAGAVALAYATGQDWKAY